VKRSGPAKFSILLEQALSRLGLDRRLDDYRVWEAWDAVVGRTISRNAQPSRLDGTRLIVTVRSSAWLQELSLLQRELIARINEWMQREVVRELFFVVGRVEHPKAPAPTPPPPVVKPGPSEIEEVAPIDSAMSPETAAIFERLWRAAKKKKPA
jgi:hypothetical protein